MKLKISRSILANLICLALFAPLAAAQGTGQAAVQTATAPTVDAAAKQAIVDEICSLLNASYVFPETAKKIEAALRERLKSGGFDQITNADMFARAVTRTLTDVGKDLHMGFVYNPAGAEDMRRLGGQSQEEARRVRERQLRRMQEQNFGFQKVERMEGNVGYLDFRMFADPSLAGPTAVAALNFLAYCDAIIVDLRQNGGGEPSQIQLISSYFFPEPVHLNDIYDRTTGQTDYYYTLPYVPGAKPVNADLYILTSRRTFSGAEEFAYNMKNLKRGTVLGETTGGGAHPTMARVVQKDYILRIPFARSINPVSKTNWEGTGVTPDIACPAAEAFDKAYAMAVEKLAAKAADPQRKAGLEALLRRLQPAAKEAK